MEHISKHLIIRQSTELQLPESNVQKTGDELALELAIKHLPLKRHELEDVKGIIRFLFVKVGLRAQNFPAEEEKQILIQHIIENYGGHTIPEIKLAFDMAMSGKLELKPEDVKCYENFSCMYFSTIMNAYRAWASQAIRNIAICPPEEIKVTDEQIANEHRMITQQCYERCLAGDLTYFPKELMHGILCYDQIIVPETDVELFFKWCIDKGIKEIYRRC